MSGHAKLRVFDREGQLVSECIMHKSTLRIGRHIADTAEEPLESAEEIQDFKLSAELSGVSREHASISWSEKDMGFQILIKGRNGAIVNRRKVNVDESAILNPRQVSSLALGRSCFVYFAPAMQPKKSNLPLASPKTGDESRSAKKASAMRWQPAVVKEFTRRETQTIELNELLASLSAAFPEQCEASSSWKTTVRKLVRKVPFVFEDSNQIVCLIQSAIPSISN
jgi:FHA domain